MNKIIDLSPSRADEAPSGLISAEIDLQIATAHRFPRSLERFRKTAMANATLTEEIAQQCLFALPRDGKVIEGPSIRLAEILISAWGNCRSGARLVREDREFIVAQGVFHDLESNSAITMETQRRITNREGKRFGADMIVTTGNAAASIALRNAVTRGIPKALWWDVYLAAKKTVVGDVKTLATKRENAIAAFMPFGIVEAQIVAALGVQGRGDIGPDQLTALFGWLTAIKDEGVDPEELFQSAKSLRAAPVSVARAAPTQAAPKAEPSPAPQKRTAADEIPEPIVTRSPIEDEIANSLLDAANENDIDTIWGFFADAIQTFDGDQQKRIDKIFADARAQFASDETERAAMVAAPPADDCSATLTQSAGNLPEIASGSPTPGATAAEADKGSPAPASAAHQMPPEPAPIADEETRARQFATFARQVSNALNRTRLMEVQTQFYKSEWFLNALPDEQEEAKQLVMEKLRALKSAA